MFKVPEKYRITEGPFATDESYGNNGMFIIPLQGVDLVIIASDGEGWEHVSVSVKDRTPYWYEMCFVKDMFWSSEDCVIQFHPPASEYVNNHNHCLHLWKPVGEQIKTPPSILVGIK